METFDIILMFRLGLGVVQHCYIVLEDEARGVQVIKIEVKRRKS